MGLGFSINARALDSTLVLSLERQIPAWLDWYRVPGLGVAVVEGDSLVWQGAFGLADQQSGERLSPDHRFPVGAITETLSTFTLIQLARQGRLDLDGSVNTQVQSWQIPADRFETGECLVRLLLCHAGGFPAIAHLDPSPADTSGLLGLLNGVQSHGRAARLAYRPGFQFEPSPFDFAILSLLAEEKLGVPFPQYMQNIVFPALGMHRSTFFPADSANLCAGHDLLERPWFPPASPLPAGDGLYTTVGDLGHFLGSLMRDYRGVDKPSRVMWSQPQLALEGIWSWQADAVAPGHFVEVLASGDTLWVQEGSIGRRYWCRFYADPQAGRALILFSNSANGRPLLDRVGRVWSRSVYGKVPKGIRNYTALYTLSAAIGGLLILWSIGMGWRLYRTREKRMFGVLKGSRWQLTLLALWVGLLLGVIYLGLDRLQVWVPHQMIFLILPVFAYLLILLLWLLSPRMVD